MIPHSAIPVRVTVLKSFFQPTHPYPASLKTACPVWEIPPAADHLPATPVARDPVAVVGKMWTRPDEPTPSKDRIADVSAPMPVQMASLFSLKAKASQTPGKLHWIKSSVFWKHFQRKAPIVPNWRWAHYIFRRLISRSSNTHPGKDFTADELDKGKWCFIY